MTVVGLLLMTSFFSSYFHCVFSDFFMQFLLLHTSCLFSMHSNGDVVGIEKPNGISSPNFLQMIFQDCFYIPQSFALKIQDLHK